MKWILFSAVYLSLGVSFAQTNKNTRTNQLKPKVNGSKPHTNKTISAPVKPPQQSMQPSDKGVRVQFQHAMTLVQANKVQEAMDAFESLLRRYPGHQPALLQYGRLLYRVDRIPEAYQAFSRINPLGLDPDVSYEYALCHFWMRQYDKALYGFQRIPDGHPLFDLASYYGAIAALKQRRLVEAEAMMDKAVVLPEKLAKSRAAYIKHIQDMKLLFEKKGLDEEREKERTRIEAAIAKDEPPKLTAQQTDDAQIRQYQHRGLEEVRIEPNLGYIYKNQSIDKHGYAQEEANLRISYFEFRAGPLLQLPLKFGRDQGAIGLQLLARAEEQNRSGQERRNIQSDSVDDIQRIQTTDINRSLNKFAQLSANPWLELPTKFRLWVAMGGQLKFTYPDFETSDRSGVRLGYLQLGFKDKLRRIALRYQYSEILDSDNAATVGMHTVKADSDITYLNNLLETIATLQGDFYTYELDEIDGPASATSIAIDNRLLIPFGFEFGAKLSALYQTEYIFHNLPSYGEAGANGQTYTGKLYINSKPIRWFSASISEELQKTVWQLTDADPGKTSAFEQNQPDYFATFQVSVQANLLF